MSWQDQSLCSPETAEDFFPLGDERQVDVKAQYEYARRTCRVCPVQEDCLLWAITSGFDHGMFGGKTPKERRKLATSWVGEKKFKVGPYAPQRRAS